MKKLIFLLTALAVLATGAASAQPKANVIVTGWGMHYGGKVIYRYQVRNSSSGPVMSVVIGHYPSTSDGKAELSVAPDSADNSLVIPADVAARPKGWGVLIRYAEESNNFSLEWVEASYFKRLWPGAPTITDGPIATSGNNSIPPGATWDNFSVSLREVDPGYVTGHASIDVGDDFINVPIQKGDVIPPDLTLSVQRVNQNEGNGHWAIFNIKASAKDNYDPAPTLVFAPVTANQPLLLGEVSIDGGSGNWKVKLRNVSGRTYRLLFTSDDASGNTATRTFEYVVARDGSK